MTKPLFISRLVRIRAWTFSKTRSSRLSGGSRLQRLRELLDVEAVEGDAERLMAQRPHFLQAQRPNVDLAGRDAEVAHQGAGVVAGAVAGAEAGHA